MVGGNVLPKIQVTGEELNCQVSGYTLIASIPRGIMGFCGVCFWVLWLTLVNCLCYKVVVLLPFWLTVSPFPLRTPKLDTFPLCSQTSPSLGSLTEQSFINLFHALSGGGPKGLEFVSSLCWSTTGSSSLVSSQLLRVAGLQEQMLKGLPFIYFNFYFKVQLGGMLITLYSHTYLFWYVCSHMRFLFHYKFFSHTQSSRIWK